jgi:hypothetical protein
VLIAAIRELGKCPCPRCFITLDLVRELGTKTDTIIRRTFRRFDDEAHRVLVERARRKIYEQGYAVKSKHVEQLLQPTSLVPTKVGFKYNNSRNDNSHFFFPQHAFSKLSGATSFDIFSTLAVDLLHEVELGVWKALLTHLIRMLYSIGAESIPKMNERYDEICSVPSY